MKRVALRMGRYGIDAPYVPAGMAGGGLACLVSAALLGRGAARSPGGAGSLARWPLSAGGTLLLSSSAVYLHATLSGKFRVWERLLDGLALRGEEELLDIGCGRGAVLLAAARRLPGGRACGLDLWRRSDQSGNDESVTAANARAEGVGDHVELHTADMTALPFPDASFDVVTSSLAIHNLPTLDARCKALDEALRVLRPGGRLVVADIRSTSDYARHLRQVGAADVNLRNLGPLAWFGGPWVATSAVTAARAREAGPAG
jgi:arsenite methyltransferase